MSDDYVVKPLYKALTVLRELGEEQSPLTLTEICHRVQLPKTTVFRYLYTLCACGFVEHDAERGLYYLGVETLRLGQLASSQLQIRRLALPHLIQLRDRFNETASLGVLDGPYIIYVEMVESRRFLRQQARLGSRDPVYATALGKAMLAFIPCEQWASHLPQRLEPRTHRTLTSHSALAQQLAAVRQQGYAVDEQENEEGAKCVGAPIFNGQGRIHAAISVSGPVTRLTEAVTCALSAALVQTAAAISQQLGHVGKRQEFDDDTRL